MIFNWGVVALSAGSILLGSLVHGIAGFGSAQVSMGLSRCFVIRQVQPRSLGLLLLLTIYAFGGL